MTDFNKHLICVYVYVHVCHYATILIGRLPVHLSRTQKQKSVEKPELLWTFLGARVTVRDVNNIFRQYFSVLIQQCYVSYLLMQLFSIM